MFSDDSSFAFDYFILYFLLNVRIQFWNINMCTNTQFADAKLTIISVVEITELNIVLKLLFL